MSGLQHLNLLEALGITTGRPRLHGLLLGNQQPAKPSVIGLIGGHLVVQGREAVGPSSLGLTPVVLASFATRTGQREAKPRR